MVTGTLRVTSKEEMTAAHRLGFWPSYAGCAAAVTCAEGFGTADFDTIEGPVLAVSDLRWNGDQPTFTCEINGQSVRVLPDGAWSLEITKTA